MTKIQMASPYLLCCALLSSVCHAALSDEIQVYADEINAPKEFGLELHFNTFLAPPPLTGVVNKLLPTPTGERRGG